MWLLLKMPVLVSALLDAMGSALESALGGDLEDLLEVDLLEWDLTLLPDFFLKCLTAILWWQGNALRPNSPD